MPRGTGKQALPLPSDHKKEVQAPAPVLFKSLVHVLQNFPLVYRRPGGDAQQGHFRRELCSCLSNQLGYLDIRPTRHDPPLPTTAAVKHRCTSLGADHHQPCHSCNTQTLMLVPTKTGHHQPVDNSQNSTGIHLHKTLAIITFMLFADSIKSFVIRPI